MSLSAEHRAFYAANGYVVVPDLVAPDVLARMRARIDAIQAGDVGTKVALTREASAGGVAVAMPPLRKLMGLATAEPMFEAVARSAAILDAVAALTGNPEHILLYADQAFLKPAHCGTPKPLHQDNAYFRVEPMHAGVTCWMAIDDATVENGCMNYVPGSHLRGLFDHHATADPTHTTPSDLPADMNLPIPVPVPAGACIFHHLLALHESKANRSDKPRRAWALHYVDAAAHFPAKGRESMTQVR